MTASASPAVSETNESFSNSPEYLRLGYHYAMLARPERNEAAPYYFKYIDRIREDDVIAVLEQQRTEIPIWLREVSEDRSLHRYAPDKWSMREVLSHMNDTERVMVSRALWFARGFDTPLPSFDQNICLSAAGSNNIGWSAHVEEFEAIRLSSVHFFRNLSRDAWTRKGIASDNPFSVRALAFLIAGHAVHHLDILRERYLQS